MIARRLTHTGLALVAVALLGAALAAPAAAQAAPYTAYGVGLEPGVVVGVFVNGNSCDTATANAAGEWGPLYVGTATCPASPGAEISFTLDGQPANETVTFEAGGAPENPAQGISLTLADEPGQPQQPGTPELPSLGTLPASGVALAVSPGGDVDLLRAAAAASGCGTVSAWASTTAGGMIGYLYGAPAFINQAFLAAFPEGVSQGSPVLLVCDPGSLAQ